MRFKFLWVALLAAFIAGPSIAQEWALPLGAKDTSPLSMHVRSGVLYWDALFNPAAADTNGIKTSFEGPQVADTVITFTAGESDNLDYPRNVTLQVAGTQANVDVGTVTLTGTNILGDTITEDYAFTENMAPGTVTGTKAFKSVTSLAIHVQDGGNVMIGVGFGAKFGLRSTNITNGVLFADMDGTREATPPTVTASPTAIESNGITFNTAPNGARDYHWLVAISPYRTLTADSR